jgi:hypothetical protein
MTATNKRLLISESHGDSNRCTLCRGKPDQHATYARCTLPVGDPRTWQPFARRRWIWIDPTAPEKKWLPTQSTVRWLIDPRVHTQLLSWPSQWSRGRKPSSCRWPTTRFIGPISPACDHYIQYLLTGANPSALTDTDGAHNFGGVGFPHTTL